MFVIISHNSKSENIGTGENKEMLKEQHIQKYQ